MPSLRRDLGEQTRLADPAFADENEATRLAGRGAARGPHELVELDLAADDDRGPPDPATHLTTHADSLPPLGPVNPRMCSGATESMMAEAAETGRHHGLRRRDGKCAANDGRNGRTRRDRRASSSLGADSDNTDPAYLAALGAVADAAGVDLSSLEPPQRAMVLGLIRLSFRQADDQLNDPDRPLGWTHTDPTVLEGMGRMSMMIPTLLAGAPEFASLTSFLDVGTGVGLLAVSAASVWPKATIVGIDVWEPSLERARKNVSEAGLADRITLRNQDLAALDDTATYDGAWVPTFFIPEVVLTSSVTKIVDALRPGGWVALGLFKKPPEPLPRATGALRNIRDGGANLDPAQATALLDRAGCAAIRAYEPAGPAPIVFVIGEKPA